MNKIKVNLEGLRKNKVQGIITRSRAKRFEREEKNTKYFLNLENRNYSEKQIGKLILENGTETKDSHTILNDMYGFFTKSYKSNEHERVTDWETEVMDKIKRLDETETEELDCGIF